MSVIRIAGLASIVALIVIGVVYIAMMNRHATREPAKQAVADQPVATGWSTEVTVSPNGHFYINAMVGSTSVRFLIDTGATSVVLSRQDAERLRVHIDRNDYIGLVETAGGQRRAARVNLPTMRIEDNWFYDIEALIVEGGGQTSLLGMNFLSELENFEFTDRVLTLYW